MTAQTAAPLQNLRQHLASSRSLTRLLTYHQRREVRRRERTPDELERARAIAAAKAAAANAASPRFMYRKTPLGLADSRRLARAVGVRKLTPTAGGILGFVRRAVASGKSGLWLSQKELARRLNCHQESVRRALRQLERLELVVRVTQFHDEGWLNKRARGGERLERSMQMPSVLVLGPVGRQWCEPARTRRPRPESASRRSTRPAPARRRWRDSWGGYNLYPPKALPSGSLPEGRESRDRDSGGAGRVACHVSPVTLPAGAQRHAGGEESPSETGGPAACRRPQSNAPAAPAVTLRGHVTTPRPEADGGGEGAAPPGGAGRETAPAGAWLSLCPDIAASTERDGPPPAAAPGAAERVRRGDS